MRRRAILLATYRRHKLTDCFRIGTYVRVRNSRQAPQQTVVINKSALVPPKINIPHDLGQRIGTNLAFYIVW